MPTPYVDELALISKNNEGISEFLQFVETVDGVDIPINLTGRQFFAQSRMTKFPTGTLICNINVEIYGEPELGYIHIWVDDEVLNDIVAPKRGHWDLLTRMGDEGIIDNIFMAPFKVEGGVSQWPSQ